MEEKIQTLTKIWYKHWTNEELSRTVVKLNDVFLFNDNGAHYLSYIHDESKFTKYHHKGW